MLITKILYLNKILPNVKKQQLFIYVLVFIGLSALTYTNFFYNGKDIQNIYIAESFLHGKLYFLQKPYSWQDTSFFNGHYYWPLGIFSSVLMTPFVLLFGSFVNQGVVSLTLTLTSMYLLYRIALKLMLNKEISFLLSIAYVFSSAYIFPASFPASWYFAHIITTVCILAAIFFTVVKQKPFFAGIFFAFSFLTRISLIFGIVFFLLYYFIFEKPHFKRILLQFLIPVILGAVLFFSYNYARFGNIFETGYKYQILHAVLTKNREFGMWSTLHIPYSIYSFVFKIPEVFFYEGSHVIKKVVISPWGLSFLFTSPIFLYLLYIDLKDKLNICAAAATIFIMVFLFGSFGTGAFQFGYRFALDFQPFIFIMLFSVFRKSQPLLVPVIVASSFLNWLMVYNLLLNWNMMIKTN